MVSEYVKLILACTEASTTMPKMKGTLQERQALSEHALL